MPFKVWILDCYSMTRTQSFFWHDLTSYPVVSSPLGSATTTMPRCAAPTITTTRTSVSCTGTPASSSLKSSSCRKAPVLLVRVFRIAMAPARGYIQEHAHHTHTSTEDTTCTHTHAEETRGWEANTRRWVSYDVLSSGTSWEKCQGYLRRIKRGHFIWWCLDVWGQKRRGAVPISRPLTAGLHFAGTGFLLDVSETSSPGRRLTAALIPCQGQKNARGGKPPSVALRGSSKHTPRVCASKPTTQLNRNSTTQVKSTQSFTIFLQT